jgi:peptidyl-prolyl cis-trans isomerase C
MGKSWLLCVLLATMAWGQAAPSAPPPVSAPPASQMNPQAPATPADASASVPPTAPVITIDGVCQPKPKATTPKGTAAKPATAAKSSAASAATDECKTVVTKAEFEKLASALSPNVTPQLRNQLAGAVPRLIAMSTEAKKEGIDKTDQYKEALKFVQMQVLANELQRKMQADAANISDADIQKYYDDHKTDYEQFDVDRLFVPRTKQVETQLTDESPKNEKLSEEDQKAKQAAEKAKIDAAEQSMTKLAEDLRTRAAAGEDFAKLQKEAFESAGMKIDSPTVNLANVRRSGLPAAHAAVFELKPGEVSQVISDNGGHYIYKLDSKSDISLDQAKTEIHGRLQSDRMRDAMERVTNSFKVEKNEAYFGPASAPATPRPMRPRPDTLPNGPSSQPQAQPPVPPGAN